MPPPSAVPARQVENTRPEPPALNSLTKAPVSAPAAACAQVAGVHQAAAGAQLGDEGVGGAAGVGLEGVQGGEVARVGPPDDVGVAGGVHGDAAAAVPAVSAEVGAENQGGAVG